MLVCKSNVSVCVSLYLWVCMCVSLSCDRLRGLRLPFGLQAHTQQSKLSIKFGQPHQAELLPLPLCSCHWSAAPTSLQSGVYLIYMYRPCNCQYANKLRVTIYIYKQHIHAHINKQLADECSKVIDH